ncbi:hypothetical protein FRC11_012424 [Ceratobasidium sp. 423]|nr:hypothetical protein FRC11_012424 [Ceratobasidium sp. 423]
MSYDYHGPWDITVNGANSSALPQTSLEGIMESAPLYTRARYRAWIEVDPHATIPTTPSMLAIHVQKQNFGSWYNYVALEIKRSFTPDPTELYPVEFCQHSVTTLEGVVNCMMITGDNQYKEHVTTAQDASTDGAISLFLGPAAFHECHDDALWIVLLYFKIDEWLGKIGNKDSRYWVGTFHGKAPSADPGNEFDDVPRNA